MCWFKHGECAATDGITGASVDANGKVITLPFDEDLHATDPADMNFTVTIGDQSLRRRNVYHQHGDGCDER